MEAIEVDVSLFPKEANNGKVNFYAVHVVNKISSKGKPQKRVLLLSSVLLMQLGGKDFRSVKRVVSVDEIVTISRDERQKLWRLEVVGDRDWLVEELQDTRNNPSTMEEFLNKLKAVRKVRTDDPLDEKTALLNYEKCSLKRTKNTATVVSKMERYEKTKGLPKARLESKKQEAQQLTMAQPYTISLSNPDESWGLKIHKTSSGHAKITECSGAAAHHNLPTGIIYKIDNIDTSYEEVLKTLKETKESTTPLKQLTVSIFAEQSALNELKLQQGIRESTERIQKQAQEIDELRMLLKEADDAITSAKVEENSSTQTSITSGEEILLQDALHLIEDSEEDDEREMSVNHVVAPPAPVVQMMPQSVAEKLMYAMHSPKSVREAGGVHAALERVRTNPMDPETFKLLQLERQLSKEKKSNQKLVAENDVLRAAVPADVDPRASTIGKKDFSSTLRSWYSGTLGVPVPLGSTTRMLNSTYPAPLKPTQKKRLNTGLGTDTVRLVV
eukprot:TRINITY_DN19222_c2_g1_i1.p1 TRINITY_DN19222_c2_g1~~TRINITY_DN19222_c2_g1_i1.p1  ORF type:complete len:501 (+),score=89.87 TRINITY_DN19222_c2_g1_i1:47-1549(+)